MSLSLVESFQASVAWVSILSVLVTVHGLIPLLGVNMGTLTYIALATSMSERAPYLALLAIFFSTGSV
jgi:hypothetical protein